MYKEIENLIQERAKLVQRNLDEVTLKYYTNYFYVLQNNPILPNDITIEELIDNALRYKLKFFTEDDKINEKYGKEFKGVRINKEEKDDNGIIIAEANTIYIRDILPEPLREMLVYHELHHAVQTNPKTNGTGINQEGYIGRLIMEAQTQYFAEKVYQEIHGVQFEEREIPSENLRMLGNGIVVSKMHNYEMHDNLLTKLAIMLNVSKDYFVSINYLYKDNIGLKNLEERYNEIRKQKGININFKDGLLTILDYIYHVDLNMYTKPEQRKIIIQGGSYLSLAKQRAFFKLFDNLFFGVVLSNENHHIELLRYVVDNNQREQLEQKVLTNTTNKRR